MAALPDHNNHLASSTGLARVAAALHESLRLEDVLARVLAVAADLVQDPRGGIALYDAASEHWQFAAWNTPDENFPIVRARLPRDSGLLGLVFTSNDLIEIPNTQDDPYLRDYRDYHGPLPERLTVIPLLLRGAVVGALIVAGVPPTEEERYQLRVVGELAAVAIANARLYEESQRVAAENARLAERAAALRAVGAAMVEERDLNRVLDVIARSLRQIIVASGCQISLLDEGGRSYTIAAVDGSAADRYGGQRILLSARTLTGLTLRTGKVQISNQALGDPRTNQRRVSETKIRNVLSVPLRTRGRVLGALSVFNKEEGDFNAADAEVVTAFAQQAAVAIDNARLFAAGRQTLLESEALRRLSRDISEEVMQAMSTGHEDQLQSILGLVATRARELAEADGVGVAVLDRKGVLRWAITAGEFQGAAGDPVAEGSLALRATQQGAPVSTQHQSWTVLDEEAEAPLFPEGVRAAVAVPLAVAGTATLGALLIGWRDNRIVTSRTVVFAERVAGLAATAVQNGRIVRQARELVAMQERARLARDLHDSVTQTLFSLSLLAQTLPNLWDSYPDEARSSVADIRTLSQDALAEMRALLYQLRPLPLRDGGLPAALQHLAEAYRRSSGPAVRLSVQGDVRPDPAVEEALFRIAQEALNNARRHSGATTVDVQLQLEEAMVTLCVSDDGRGFVPDALEERPGHLGMTSMRERTQAIGGQFTVDAAPGRGTTIRIQVPAVSAARELRR